MDKWTYPRAMPFLCTVTAVLIGTLSLTAKLHEAFFFLWVCLIYLCIGGFYAMFPAYTSISFGNYYLTANYGWVFTNQFISAFVSAFFVNLFIGTLGNTGVTLALAFMLLLAACLSFFGKKWDYHVGRRELQKKVGSATVPSTVVLPPDIAAAEKPVEKPVEAPKPVETQTPEEIKVDMPAAEMEAKPVEAPAAPSVPASASN